MVLLFVWLGIGMAERYYGVVEMPLLGEKPILGGSDFPAFYAGSKLFFADTSHAYDADAQTRAILAAKGYGPEHEEKGSQWYRYYNPPVYSVLLAPLTLFEVRTAFALTLLINAAGLYLLLRVLSDILGQRRELFPSVATAVILFVPVNYAFWHAQPTLFLAALFGLALASAEKSRKARTGVYWALLVVKPHWLIVPPFALDWRKPRLLTSLLLVTGALLLPFLAIGPQGIRDYVQLTLSRGHGDLTDASFAEAVLSWSGFLRGLTGEAQTSSAIVMSILTLAVFAIVWRRGGVERMALAAPLTLLLVVPHSHPQDWIMLAPGAVFLLRGQQGAPLVFSAALLLGVVIGLHNWAGLERSDQAFYWPTLMGFLLLVWLAVLSRIEARPRDSSPSLHYVELADVIERRPARSSVGHLA